MEYIVMWIIPDGVHSDVDYPDGVHSDVDYSRWST